LLGESEHVPAGQSIGQQEAAVLLSFQGVLQERECSLFPDSLDNPLDLPEYRRLGFA
jgi:hypothetical protein